MTEDAGNSRSSGSNAEPAVRPRGWGLLPDVQWQQLSWRELLHYWFVQFNPLYFISALCMLIGVFLVARNIEALDARSPERVQLLLFAVIQAYEFLLIGGAALLVHRAGAVRPAVILVLLEAVFLFDCTFRLESAVYMGPLAYWLTGGWFVLTLVKVRALVAAMRLELSRQLIASIGVCALGIVVAIHWLSQAGADKLLALQAAAWFGTLVLFLLHVRAPALACALARTPLQQGIARRCANGTLRLLAAFYFYHLWSYIVFAADPDVLGRAILPQLGAFALLQTLVRAKDQDVWKFAVLTFGAALSAASALPYAALLLAAVVGYRVWRGARSGLAAGAAFSAYVGVWLFGWMSWDTPLPPLPAAFSAQTIALALVLCLLVWRLRDPLALAALALGSVYSCYRYAGTWLPASELGWGILLLACGFGALGAGIAINWRFRDSAARTPSSLVPGSADGPAKE